MWLAILITVVAAAGNNIGKALQKQATKSLPHLTFKREVLDKYLRSHVWLAGMAADLAGALLMIAAFSLAPVSTQQLHDVPLCFHCVCVHNCRGWHHTVCLLQTAWSMIDVRCFLPALCVLWLQVSVVQPVSAMGLVFLMIFSHYYLRERLQPSEWAAAATAGIGILLLGASSEPEHTLQPQPSAVPQQQQPHIVQQAQHQPLLQKQQARLQPTPPPLQIFGTFTLMVLLLFLECYWRQRRQQRRHKHAAADSAADAAYCGLEAGVCFGFSAAACRTGMTGCSCTRQTAQHCTLFVMCFAVLQTVHPSA